MTDVAVAAELARVAACARLNVEINLAGLTDEDARRPFLDVLTGVDEVLARAEKVTTAVRENIQSMSANVLSGKELAATIRVQVTEHAAALTAAGTTPRLAVVTAGLPAFAPATAEAVVTILDHYQIELEGRPVVVIGRSPVVGEPTAHLLLDRNATVTVCHSRRICCRASGGFDPPVPGGVGPVTTALLLQHTAQAVIR